MAVDPVGEVLVPNAGHAIADHPHAHARAEMEAEVDAVQERERRAEREADNGHGRRVVRRECLLDVGEDRGCGPAQVFVGMRSKNDEERVTYRVCSKAKPWCTSMEDGIPGKRVGSSGSSNISTSVRTANLTRG